MRIWTWKRKRQALIKWQLCIVIVICKEYCRWHPYIQFVRKVITVEALALRQALESNTKWLFKDSCTIICKDYCTNDTKKKKMMIVSWKIDTICEDMRILRDSFEEINFVRISCAWNILTYNIDKFSLFLLHI